MRVSSVIAPSLQRNVEIDAHENAAAGQIEIR